MTILSRDNSQKSASSDGLFPGSIGYNRLSHENLAESNKPFSVKSPMIPARSYDHPQAPNKQGLATGHIRRFKPKLGVQQLRKLVLCEKTKNE